MKTHYEINLGWRLAYYNALEKCNLNQDGYQLKAGHFPVLVALWLIKFTVFLVDSLRFRLVANQDKTDFMILITE